MRIRVSFVTLALALLSLPLAAQRGGGAMPPLLLHRRTIHTT